MGNGTWEGCHVDSRVDHLFPPSLYIFVIGVGLPTNCLALWAAYRQVRQRNELGVYLMNLSIADLLYICTLPLWVDYFLHHDNWIHGPGSCKLFGFIFYTNIYISIAFLCCISVDRYLAVAHPLRFARLRRVKTAVAVSSVVWATELGANSVPLFHDELFRDRYNHTFCFEKFPMEGWVAWMNLYRVFVGFLFPCGAACPPSARRRPRSRGWPSASSPSCWSASHPTTCSCSLAVPSTWATPGTAALRNGSSRHTTAPWPSPASTVWPTPSSTALSMRGPAVTWPRPCTTCSAF